MKINTIFDDVHAIIMNSWDQSICDAFHGVAINSKIGYHVQIIFHVVKFTLRHKEKW